VTTHAATDDRCANFSASTCPTQPAPLTTSSLADKLPLEKFHRLLDLVFRGKFLKLHNIPYFIFFFVVIRVSPGITGYHRVSPGITGYHRVSPGITGYHRVSPDPASKRGARPGGAASRSYPPRPTI
jgi:hypothetical protein